MKKLFKYCEFLFFGLINAFFSLGILIIPFIFSFLPKDGEVVDKYIVNYLILFLLILLLYVCLKIFTFPFIYWLRTLFPNIHKFLFKIVNLKKFRYKFLTFCLLCDFAIFLALFLVNKFDFMVIYSYLILLGGILPSYIVFLFLLKIFKPIGFLFKIKSIHTHAR